GHCSVRTTLRNPAGQAGPGRFRLLPHRLHRPARCRAIVWLFSMVLGHSRMMWGRFVAHQDLQTVLRCHIAAFEALGGVPAEILYDRMKTAVLGEVDDQGIAYNRKLLDLAAYYRFLPKACAP